MNLSRAVDSQGNTQEFLLSSPGEVEAAKRFFESVLEAFSMISSRVIPVDYWDFRLLP